MLILALIMFGSLALLAGAIWFIQIGQGHDYLLSQDRQSIRRVRLPTVRGRIFDRNGICLAGNQPDYGICIYLEELLRSGKKRPTARKAWDMVQELARITGVEPQTTLRRINDHIYMRKPLPMPVWLHLDHKAMARFAEISMHFPAADIALYPKRIYPCGALAGHIIGYVGTGKAGEDTERDYHYYLPDMEGKRGLEKVYNKWLAGSAGGSLIRIDVAGFKHDEESIREPVPGGDLRLSLDLRLQRLAEEALAGECGAAVIVNPENGDVLAMASAPGFDPGMFYPHLAVHTWQALVEDKRKPLFNRAISGSYAPGSIFKPLIAIAALIQGKATADTVLKCDGSLALGGRVFSCHGGVAHGDLDIARALEVSCNVFFYKLGLQCGYDAIYHMALAAGFGEKTGLDLDGESAGLLPSKSWKRQTKGELWRDGDTCNIAIGQGDLLVTPLQMAMFAAAIANGGRLYRPRLVIGRKRHDQSEFEPVPPILERDLRWSADHLAVVREGMRRVVCEPSGTGHLAGLPQVAMAGKTGTAEFGRKGSGRQRGWMILFAPFARPQYAVAMVMDAASGSGGADVGPRLGKMMAEIFADERRSAE